MKKILLLTLIILVFSCKEKTDSRIIISERKIKNEISKVDYHQIIDVVLDTFKDQNDKIIHIEYKPDKKAMDSSSYYYLIKNSRLAEDEKELATQLIENGKDSFNFKKSKLNRNSIEILQNKGKTTDRNLTYYFRSFLSNKENDLVVSTIGAIMNNESYATKNSGAELIIFFRKIDNNRWKLSNYTTTIEY